MDHHITRLRHELKRRQISVESVISLTPSLLRIVFTGPDLADFNSPAPDNHVKLFFPTQNGEMEGRDYTPRAFDNKAQTLSIDFALHPGTHDVGPATRWALLAKPGDQLECGGPRGSTIISPDFDWWLLIGDETAMPSIARRMSELPARTKMKAVITVANPADENYFTPPPHGEVIWLHRPADQAHNPAMLLDRLRTMDLPPGDGFLWIASEAMVARAVRDYLVNERGHRLAWSKSSGYWLHGAAATHDKL